MHRLTTYNFFISPPSGNSSIFYQHAESYEKLIEFIQTQDIANDAILSCFS